jgi:hypothetical protein
MHFPGFSLRFAALRFTKVSAKIADVVASLDAFDDYIIDICENISP